MSKDEHHVVNGVPTPYDTSSLNKGLPLPKGAQDIAFGILFVLNLIAFMSLTAYGSVQFAHRQEMMMTNQAPKIEGSFDEALDPGILPKLLISIVAAALVSMFVAAGYLWVAARYPRELIIGTIVANVLMYLVAAGAMAYVTMSSNDPEASFVPSIVMAAVGLLHACLYLLWRRRIPFAALILSTVAQVTQAFHGMAIYSFISLFILLLWNALWVYGAIMTMGAFENNTFILAVYLVFAFYWGQQVCRNVLHVSVCGVFATWYFMGGQNAAIPKNPTLKSLKRAMTTSFGSICFGSLLVAILQTIRAIVRSLRSKKNPILYCLVACILACVQRLMEYFNTYAFAIVAIYGDSFCVAAKKVFGLMQSHGIKAIINDSIVSNVLTFGCILGAVLGGLVGFLTCWILIPGTNFWVLWAIAAFFGFLLGFISMAQVLTVVDSGVTTIFVAYALDPEALGQNDVALKEAFDQTASLI